MKGSFRRLAGLCITLLAAAAPLASNVTPAEARTAGLTAPKLVVDDDRAQCPTAQYTTIQSAIDAAPAANGTVTVCAGSYPEAVSINGRHNFKLIGKKGAVITVPNPAFDGTLVGVSSSTNVTIQGFIIDGQGQVGAQNADIALGYYLASGTIQKNTIRNWTTPANGTFSNGMYAMALGGVGGAPIKVTRNVINGFQDHAISVRGRIVVTITRNTISGTSASPNDPYGIYVIHDGDGTPSGTIKSNKLTSTAFPSASNGAAIYIQEANPFTISGNTVTHWGIGLQMLAFCGSGLSVSHNVVKGNKFNEVNTGIVMQSTPFYSCDSHLDFITVTGNKVTDTVQKGSDGITLVASWNGVLNANALSEVIKGNTVKHFNSPYSFSVSGPQVFVSGVFAPNKTLP